MKLIFSSMNIPKNYFPPGRSRQGKAGPDQPSAREATKRHQKDVCVLTPQEPSTYGRIWHVIGKF